MAVFASSYYSECCALIAICREMNTSQNYVHMYVIVIKLDSLFGIRIEIQRI